MNGVHVIVASFGDSVWQERAGRAVASLSDQTVQPQWVTRYHVTSPTADLGETRNSAAATRPEAKWLIFLDADDTLHPEYVESMLSGTADVRQPSTSDGVGAPELIPKRDLMLGNYIVVGAMMSKAAFDAVGGFRPLPIYEDWDLWLRMEEYGATFESVPAAIYVATVRPNSRNRQPASVQQEWMRKIRHDAQQRRAAPGV